MMFCENLKGALEALLFASGNPLGRKSIAILLSIDEENIEELIDSLQEDLKARTRGLIIKRIGDRYQLATKPEMASYIDKLLHTEEKKLSVPALETLSIIAFKQPITKQEIEDIRGVRVDNVLSRLLENDLIREVGRRKVVGRPLLYGTTDNFLKCFGLTDLAHLPHLAE